MSKFHIHIDAITLNKEFENYVLNDLGFWRSDFAGHPEGVEHFEPPHHLTAKPSNSAEFRRVFDRLVSYAKENAPIRGYLEGEFISSDEDLPERPFNPNLPSPFQIAKTNLPAGGFRETEIHVVMNRDKSDPRLLQALLDMGLYTAYMQKSYGIAQIFTVQGSRKNIDVLLPALRSYLNEVGGSVNCSIKEERVAEWWLSEPGLRLPPVVDAISWMT